MTIKTSPSFLETTRTQLRDMVEEADLNGVDITVLAKPLTPEEAIGEPGRRDFPIAIGKERVLEAQVLGARGHAFTDSPREFVGHLEDVLKTELRTNADRAIYTATLNAVMRHLGRATATVHCRNDEPEDCALEIAQSVLERHGRIDVGLIGLNPAIAEALVATFGADHVRICDLDADHIGRRRFGVEIWNGRDAADTLIESSDVVLVTGTSLVNDTFDRIWHRIVETGRVGLVYGVTAAAVCALCGFERICPRGHD